MEGLCPDSQIHGNALKKLIAIFLFIPFLPGPAAGQKSLSSSDRKALAYFEEAMMQYRMGQSVAVEDNLKLAIARDSNFTEAYLELGLMYGEKRKYATANSNLDKVIALGGSKYPQAYYYKGLFLLNQGKYADSKATLQLYLQSGDSVQNKKENAERMIVKCDFGMKNAGNSVQFKPVNMGPAVNSRDPEYYPCLTADDGVLLFTREVVNPKRMDGADEEFFICTKGAEGGWSQSLNMGPPINTLNNEGAPTLSVDGLLLIFTACPLYGDYGPGRQGFGSCDLFFSQRSGSTWSKPRNIGPPVSTPAWETQPSFSSDGRSLFFIRGKTSGSGIKDQDIYQTFLTDSGWTEPVRLPHPVNSPGFEESVFIHPDGKTLYFSSDGHPGFGGLDIFMTKKSDDGSWSTPLNLGYPINTENDENSLMVNARGNIGYFASDRAGGYGGLDLYSFELPADKRPETVTFMKGRVFDAATKKPLLAKFELLDLKTGKTIIESYSNGGNGEFLVCLPSGSDYALNASRDGYLFYSDNFSLSDSARAKPVVKDVPLIPIAEGARVVLNNIFFETNKYDLKAESRVELEKLRQFLKTNGGVKIEIGGHTDNTGSREINVALSNNRAKAVFDYLVNAGVDASRLSYKGYADEQAIASNESSLGRAKNRRTEFRITGITP